MNSLPGNSFWGASSETDPIGLFLQQVFYDAKFVDLIYLKLYVFKSWNFLWIIESEPTMKQKNIPQWGILFERYLQNNEQHQIQISFPDDCIPA